jgi:hypothetical protein
MEFKKEDLMEMAKSSGLNLAEDALEMAAKRLSIMTIDMLAKFVDDGKIDWKDMIFAASEDKLRELAESIEVHL